MWMGNPVLIGFWCQIEYSKPMNRNETPLFKAFTFHNGGQKLRDIADSMGMRSVSRWTVALVMAAASAATSHGALQGKQGYRELADSITSRATAPTPPVARQLVSLRRGMPLRAPEPS